MARRRDDDDYDRPRRSRRDDDEDDRPRRSRRDDDDDEDDDRFRRRRPKRPMGPLDGMFRDTHIIILVLFGLFCNGIALILSIIGVCTGKDPTGKSNAMILLILSLMVTVFGGGIMLIRILSLP